MKSVTEQGLAVEWWPTERPIPYARNPRVAPEAAIATVAGSLAEFGWQSARTQLPRCGPASCRSRQAALEAAHRAHEDAALVEAIGRYERFALACFAEHRARTEGTTKGHTTTEKRGMDESHA